MHALAVSCDSSRALPQPRTRRVRPYIVCKAHAESYENEVHPGVFEGFWAWRGHRVRYQRCGAAGPPVLLVHGFCGSCDHWRKNLAPLGAAHRAFAIDLLGYGYSDKPDPRLVEPHSLYNFETWGRQLADFLEQRAGGGRATVVGNSAGGMAALQAAIYAPRRIAGVQLIDCALRRLHPRRQPPLQRPLVGALQAALRDTWLGRAFYARVAQREVVRQLLREAYGHKEAVTDELVDLILRPGLQPGAAAVFLEAITWSEGPLPEELLAQVTVPVSVLWGTDDPWEREEDARALLGSCPAVIEFVELPGCGHCPQDEAPELVNPLIAAFVARCQRRPAAPAQRAQRAGRAQRMAPPAG
ncbi:MAG: Alpha/Beta hydrolase protein [Monoraphidium minutum]|nr:MAG: Alpha/Beta hydrolase protein [Monoraphidium minutum]